MDSRARREITRLFAVLQLVARLVGELRELLAMGLDESGYAVAVAELGMEVDPPAPYAPGAWLELVAHRLGMPPADYAAAPHEDMG